MLRNTLLVTILSRNQNEQFFLLWFIMVFSILPPAWRINYEPKCAAVKWRWVSCNLWYDASKVKTSRWIYNKITFNYWKNEINKNLKSSLFPWMQLSAYFYHFLHHRSWWNWVYSLISGTWDLRDKLESRLKKNKFSIRNLCFILQPSVRMLLAWNVTQLHSRGAERIPLSSLSAYASYYGHAVKWIRYVNVTSYAHVLAEWAIR